MKVAIYLRVSTLDQATKGNTNRDGFSIPAQREACRCKAESLKATVIREYVIGVRALVRLLDRRSNDY